MKNRAMMIGSVGAGKSTLTHALLGKKVDAVKTQSLVYYDWIVDTPGEYTENPMYYKNIMATSLEVTHVLFIQDAVNKKYIFPPGFSSGINKLSIGVVTKADHENADVKRAINQLKKVMVKGPIVITSAYTNQGTQEIKNLCSLSTLEEIKSYTEEKKSANIVYHETLYK